MTWHPLTWAFWTAALTGILLYGLAAVRAMDLFLNWDPDRADIHQLRREHRAEIASLLAQGSFMALAAAAALGLIGVAMVWHPVVPGAMCGTGVLQAMEPYGRRAMLFWGLGLMIFYAWQVLDRLNRSHPGNVATRSAGRMLITAAPLLVLAVYYSWQALMHVAAVPAVSCCAAIYDRILAAPADSAGSSRLIALAFFGHLTGGITLLVLAALAVRLPGRVPGGFITALAVTWSVAASVAVKQVWSPYHYQVLSHPCPWCLFLPDAYGVGFIVFGCVVVIVMEAVAFWTADRVCRQHPQLFEAAAIRRRRSAGRIICALIGFAIASAGPAIFWRLNTGIWLKAFF